MINSVLLSNKELRGAFFLFILYCLLNSGAITRNDVLIDDEYVFNSGVCHFADVGRWLITLVKLLFWHQSVTPGGPMLIFGALFTLAYLYLIRPFEVEPLSSTAILAFAVYAIYPIWLVQLSFSANVIAVGIGLLAVSVASIWTFKDVDQWLTRAFWLRTALPASLGCALAMGAYQSLALMYLVMVLGFALAQRQREKPVRIVPLLVVAISVVMLAGLLSYLVSILVIKSCNTGVSPYAQQFFRPQTLFEDPFSIIKYIAHDWVNMYFRYWYHIGAAGITMLLCILLSLVVASTLGPKNRRISRSLWLLLLTFIPTFMIFLTGQRMPQRTLLGACTAVCILMLLALRSSASRPILRKLVAFGALLMVVQSLYVNSVAIGRAHLQSIHDRALASAIYERLVLINGSGGTHESPLLVNIRGIQPFGASVDWGSKLLNDNYPISETSTMGASFFAWDGGDLWRILSYMTLIGYTDVAGYDPGPLEAVNAVYSSMPAWPAPGSVVRFKDGFLVKLSSSQEAHHWWQQ